MHRKKSTSTSPGGDDSAATALQLTVRLKRVSPPIWRRVLVPSTLTLRELHGVFQVAMGWEGIHLFLFRIRAVNYGSWELSAHSPDVTLSSMKLRGGGRFTYEYDLRAFFSLNESTGVFKSAFSGPESVVHSLRCRTFQASLY